MIDKKTQNLINERLLELPREIQDAITNSDWQQEVREIVSKNNLLIDQGLAIENETFLMMLGIENPKNYTKNIKKEAKLTNEQAVGVAIDVDEKILRKIKSKIIENEEKALGMENNPLKDIIGPAKEVNEAIPDIDINLEDDAVSERRDLINELGGDIEIEQEETEEELAERNQFEQLSQTQKEKEISTETPDNIPVEKNTEKTLQSNKIPIIDSPNPRFIDTNFSSKNDNLPILESVRTLESDSENRDEIVSTKLAGSEIKKPDIKLEVVPEKPANREFTTETAIKTPPKPEIKPDESTEIPPKPKGPDPYRESF